MLIRHYLYTPVEAIPEDEELAEKYIRPHISEIKDELSVLRKKFDERALKNSWDQYRTNRGEKYPVGACLFIAETLHDSIVKNVHRNFSSGLNNIRDFIKQRGVLRRCWGIQNGDSFHNVLLAGNILLDVAHDALSSENEAVVISDLSQSGITQIRSFSQYAQVAEKYWGAEVFPNKLFPIIAPIYPVILLRDNVLSLERAKGLIYNNMLSYKTDQRCQMSYDFLYDSPYTEKEIPQTIIDVLYDAIKDSQEPVLELAIDDHKLEKAFSFWRDPCFKLELLNFFYKYLKNIQN